MEKGVILLVFFGVLAVSLAANVAVAQTYSLEFSQVGNILIINESIGLVQNSSYNDTSSLNFAGKEIYFLNRVVFPDNFEKAEITLNLEEGVVVKNDEVFPLGYNTSSDGQIISIHWVFEEVNKGDTLAIFVNLERTDSIDLLPWFLFVLVLVALGISWFIFFSKKMKNRRVTNTAVKIKKNKEKSEDSKKYNYLLDTEKKIIEYLKKADRNELWQKQLQLSTGFSKAKLSRLVRNLEARGLISKIPFGNTNKVRLK